MTPPHHRAMRVLDLITCGSLTIYQISRRAGLWRIQVELALIWLDEHVCLTTEDESGRIGIYQG